MFNIKYLATHKVQMDDGVISRLLYGLPYARTIIHLLALGLFSRKDVHTIQ